MALLALFQELLRRFTGQNDVIVGTPIANRHRLEAENLIGFFVNTLVLRTDLSGDSDFCGLLSKVRGVILGAFEHQDLPFEKLVEEIKPERSLSHSPLFQVMFVHQAAPADSSDMPGLRLRPMASGNPVAKFDFTFFVSEGSQEAVAVLEHNSDLFDETTAYRLLGHFRTLLQRVVERPVTRLSSISCLTEAEHHQLLREWNDAAAFLPSEPVHELFARQCRWRPDCEAVVGASDRPHFRGAQHSRRIDWRIISRHWGRPGGGGPRRSAHLERSAGGRGGHSGDAQRQALPMSRWMPATRQKGSPSSSRGYRCRASFLTNSVI